MQALPSEIIERIQEYAFDFQSERSRLIRELRAFFTRQRIWKQPIIPKFVKGRLCTVYSFS